MPSNTGDGYQMAMSVGAKDMLQESPEFMDNYIQALPTNRLTKMASETMIAEGGPVIWVNQNGRRIVNENITSSVAKDAGIISGDKIIKINNKKIEDFSEIIQEISARPDEDLCITIDRDGKIFEINLHSELDKETGTGKIGISADSQTLIKKSTPKINIFSAFSHGFLDTIEYVSLTFKSIGTLFKGVDLDNAVSGPARVTDLLGTTVKESFSEGFKIGMINMLYLMGIISISLFIMNLLPIPVLDGGLILFAFVFTRIANRIMKRESFGLSQLIYLGIIIQIPLFGVFYYSFYKMEVTVSIIIAILIARYLDPNVRTVRFVFGKKS